MLPPREAARPEWERVVGAAFAEARLETPEAPYPQTGGREGRHGEALGPMLAEMQSVHRAYPGAVW